VVGRSRKVAKLSIPDHYPPSAREVLKFLDSRAQHLSWVRRFEALVEIWFAALCRDEVSYMHLAREFGSRELLTEAARLLGECTLDVMQTQDDVLGKVYQEWSVGARSKMGQYFTPDNVCEAMARMTIADLNWSEVNKPGGFRVAEPAVGAGAMLLKVVKVIHDDHGPRALANCEFHATDLDLLCCRMAALQLRWVTIRFQCRRVVIYHGDSLGPPEDVRALVYWENADIYPPRVVRKTNNERRG